MELTDGQFEHLVGLLAENRAAILTLRNDLWQKLTEMETAQALSNRLTREALKVLDEDLTKVQATQREGMAAVAQLTQTSEGLTQLCKSTFDVAESAMKHIIEGSIRVQHDDAEKSQRAPQ